jgi:hypothetical protein
MEAVNTEMQSLSSELYSQAKTAGAEGQPGGAEAAGGEEAGGTQEGGKASDKDGGDVIDADFEMVDDNDKS